MSEAGSAAASELDEGNIEPSWRDDLPEDIRGNKSIVEIGSVEDLAKMHINGQQMLGSRIPLPDKADEDGIKEIYSKLGTPENVDGYEVTIPQIENVQFSDNDVSGFLDVAHKSNLNSDQVNAVLEFDGQRQAAIAQGRIDHRNEAESTMKSEWGNAYSQNVTMALQAAEAFGGDGFKDFLNETGLGNHPEFIRFAYNVAKEMSEDDLVGGGDTSLALTPSDAKDRINEIMADPAHPYHDKTKPGHKEALEKMAGYYNHLNPQKTGS